MKHVLGILVENHPGVLSRVSGLFSRRGFNIESLAVGITEDPDVSRITIVVDGDDYLVEQISKQLHKLIDVIKITDIHEDAIARELTLIKVHAVPGKRQEILELIDIYHAHIVDVSRDSLVIQIADDSRKINDLIQLVKDYGIKEIVRTGIIALEKGAKTITTKSSHEK
ncbi:MAG: acetolactate synthase small subunit [Candidatus Delongbacteria bacterium]|nr:acetolactate synthase small subunit [Candidatus Delongbacteria bacterium]